MGNRTGITSRGYHPAIWGMQRSMELREQLNQESTIRYEKNKTNKLLTRSYWYGRLGNALSALKAADPDGWEAWFDSDAVPDVAAFKEHALLVEARVAVLWTGKPFCCAVAKLYKNTMVWTDNLGAFIYLEDGKLIEFLTSDEARAYVDKMVARGISA